MLRNRRGLLNRTLKIATASAGRPLVTPLSSWVPPNSPKTCWPSTSVTTTTRPSFGSSTSTDSKRNTPTTMRFASRTNTSARINRWLISNLLHLIKRNKHPFEAKAQKGNKEYKDYLALKEEMDELRRRNAQIEEYLNSMIVQNGKILDDNKYLCMEILKARWNQKKGLWNENRQAHDVHRQLHQPLQRRQFQPELRPRAHSKLISALPTNW